jgi:TonB family protein
MPAVAATVAAAPAASIPVPAPATVPAAQAVSADFVPTCDELKAFKDKMHAAVDAALRYPPELRFHPTAGVTIVAYDYEDGKLSNVHLTQWSGDKRLDRSALNAVNNADFASITPGVGKTHIRDSVIIVFDNYKDDGEKNTKEREKKDKDPAADACS